jgi:hypothetical protein
LTPEELDALLEQYLSEPKSASGDGHSAENHSVADLLKLQDRARHKASGNDGAWSSTRVQRFVPRSPGAEPA